MQNYEYIILGGGAAGLNLLRNIAKYPSLNEKSIAIIDHEFDKGNDRTWCFWEQGEGDFDHILTNSWDKMLFKTPVTSMHIHIAPYCYKMMRSKDFYQSILEVADDLPNVTLVTARLDSIDGNIAKTSAGDFQGKYIFNSILYEPKTKSHDIKLLQHFKGWFIEVPEPRFAMPTFMDFSIPQYLGCDFMYVLPCSEHIALIEYTAFSPTTTDAEHYEQRIKSYIEKDLQISDYKVIDLEQGVIPMTTETIPLQYNEHTFNIGIAGGMAKPSTGFAFSFILRQTSIIAHNLAKGLSPIHNIPQTDKYDYYDAVFMDVMTKGHIEVWKLYQKLFERLSGPEVLAFLGEKTSWVADFKLMNTMPKSHFIPAAMRQMPGFIKKWVG